VLRRIFGPMREEMVGGWRRLHDDELNSFCILPNIMMIKSRRMRWVEHVARMGALRISYKILVRNMKR